MRRLTRGIMLSILFLGCGNEQEISQEQYVRIIRQVRNELAQEKDLQFSIEGSIKEIPLLGRLNHIIRDFIFFPKEHYRPWLRLRISPMRITSKYCRKESVTFKSFDKAHETYGREGLTYRNELKEYLKMLRKFTKAYKDDTAPSDSLVYISKLLAYDLGFRVHEEMTIIDVDSDGTPSIDGMTMSTEDIGDLVENRILPREEIGYLVQIMPEADTRLGYLFKISSQLKTVRRMIVSDSLYDRMMFLGFYPRDPLDTLDSDPGIIRRGNLFDTKVYIHLTSEGDIFLNSEIITDTFKLGPLIDSLFKRSSDKVTVIAVEDSIVFKDLSFVCKFAKRHGTQMCAVIPFKIIQGHEPLWNTQRILIQPPPYRIGCYCCVCNTTNRYEKLSFFELLRKYRESDNPLRRKEMRQEIWFRMRSFAAVTLLLHTCPWVFLF